MNSLKKISIYIFTISLLGCSEPLTEKRFQYQIDGDHVNVAIDVVQTTNDGFAFLGETTQCGGEDMMFFTTDQFGNVEIALAFKGDSTDIGFSLIETKDGGYLLGGQTNSFGNTRDDMPLIKLNKEGELEWSILFGGYNLDYITDLIQTEDGPYIVTGYTYSYGVGFDDIFIMKIDEQGDTLWTRRYGGELNEHCYAVKQTPDKGFVLTGFSKSFGNGYYDTYVVKVNPEGDTLWTRVFGGQFHDRGFDIYAEEDGSILITGGSETSSNNMDAMLLKLSAEGDIIWAKTYGGIKPEMSNSIDRCEDGYVLTGYTSSADGKSDHLIIKTDLEGNVMWYKAYGGELDDLAYRGISTKDQDILVIGKLPAEKDKPYNITFLKIPADGSESICSEKTFELFTNDSTISSHFTNTQITSGIEIKEHSFEIHHPDLYIIPLCKKPD
ncbi:MAG: hypothetical protein R2780_15300 [Crocinitomicaceae bacterium]|nr:hypothetical protein [Crocinitomicaceae bacterium]